MIDALNETAIRILAFLSVLLVMATLEAMRPRRRLSIGKMQRWVTNLSIIALNSVLLQIMAMATVPIAAVAAAAYAQSHGLGLLNNIALPPVAKAIIAIVVLDFAVWLQHVASHKFPLFWRVHQMHHADGDIDASTGIRFHPIEIALSMLWKIGCVFVLGAPPLAVFLFEVVLNAGAVFSHANVALPQRLDSLLRLIFVTPDMHRVHHSVLRREYDSNYGFNLSVWDRMFGTYTRQPENGHESMKIGLAPYRKGEAAGLLWSLFLPFRSRGD